MTEAEVIDRINSTIKKNGKNAITGEEMNFVLKAIIQLITDSGGVVNWGDIEGTIADQLDLASALAGKEDSLGFTPENSVNKGNANGYAPLNSSTQIDSSYLPSYVDDVLEYANFASLPGTGVDGKIYVTLDNNLTYRWSGSAYVEISASLALGETSSTAYRGDRGKTAYDHAQITGNPHGTTASDVGAEPSFSILPIAKGGTNATNAANARINLGISSAAELNAILGITSVNISTDQSTSSATAVNITDLVSGTLTTGTYLIHGSIGLNSSSGSGIKLAIIIPSGATMQIKAIDRGTATTNVVNEMFTASNTLSTNSFCSTIGVSNVIISGTVTIGGTSGTIQFAFAKSGGGTAIATREGSFLKIEKI